jgi:hypothetical protein
MCACLCASTHVSVCVVGEWVASISALVSFSHVVSTGRYLGCFCFWILGNTFLRSFLNISFGAHENTQSFVLPGQGIQLPMEAGHSGSCLGSQLLRRQRLGGSRFKISSGKKVGETLSQQISWGCWYTSVIPAAEEDIDGGSCWRPALGN